ncbi:uncharacterized protein LOC144121604 [Amblyomma americanum]
MTMSAEQRDHTLKLLQRMVYARSDEEFARLEDQLDSTAPASVLEYYNKNWCSIKNEWHKGPQFLAGSFNNTTNNRLESINAKLKSVVPLYCSLEQFVPALFSILATMQQERDHMAADSVYKRTARLEVEEHLQQYQLTLTPYAFPFVKQQDEQSKNVTVKADCQDQWRCQSSSGETVTTLHSCTCSFRLSMMLPCRHILAVRRAEGLSLYEAKLCNERWSKKYYHCKQRLFTKEAPNTPTISVTPVAKKPRPMTQQQKYKAVFPLCKYLAELASEECNDRYLKRVQALKLLKKEWEGEQSDQQNSHQQYNCTETDSASDCSFSSSPFPEEHEGNEAPVTLSEHPDTVSPIVEDESAPSPVKTASQLLLEMVPGHVAPFNEVEKAAAVMSLSPVLTVTSADSTEAANAAELSAVQMPKKIKPRGRPAGSAVTVIGLPKRRKAPKAFSDLSKAEKQKKILGWLVGDRSARLALEQEVCLGE